MSMRANTAHEPIAQSRTWYRRTLSLLAIFLALRLLSLWLNNSELFFDEAQYWLWGREPAFGYFSKPPVLGWIIGMFTGLCGDSEFCIRLPSPLFHTATALVIYLTAARMFDERTGFWSALIYATLPAVTLSSTLISTDVPLLFFWALALLSLYRFEAEDTLGWALLLGLALGAGLMSKYAMIYFLPCAVIYALVAADRPGILLRVKFWLALAVAGLCIAPNIWWNAANSFVTASHTGENIGWGGDFPNFRGFAEFFFSQFAVFGPITFGILLAALARLPVEGMNRKQLLLMCFSAPVIAVIIVQSLMSKAYANWAAVAYISGTILVADLMVNTIPDFWRRLSLPIHLGVFAVVATAVMFARPGQLPLPENMRPFERMQGARDIADAARSEINMGEFGSILTDDRRLSALMTYYLRDVDLPKKAWLGAAVPSDHYQLTRPYSHDTIGPTFYLTRNRNPASIFQAFNDAEYLGEFEPPAGETRQVWFYGLDGYLADPEPGQ